MNEYKTSPIVLCLAWLVVLVPAIWGVKQTIHTSLALFQSTPPATAPSAAH